MSDWFSPEVPVWVYVFHIVNYTWAAIGYTLIARILLEAVIPQPLHSNSFMVKAFKRMTNWFLFILKPITPRFLVSWAIMLYAFFWILVIRWFALPYLLTLFKGPDAINELLQYSLA